MFFRSNYDKPGPGVNPDEPRKKGLARFFELIARDFSVYWRAGMLAFVGLIPLLLCVWLGASSQALVFVALAIPAGALGGPLLAGLYDTVLRTLRDEPNYWWHTYKRVVKANARASLVPGALTGLFIAAEAFSAWTMLMGGTTSPLMWVALLLSAILLTALLAMVWPQLVLVELPLGTLLRNSMLLLFGCLPRALGAAAIQLVYWLGLWLLFPVSALVFGFTSVWLPVAGACLAVYVPLNEHFSIEKVLNERRENEEE